LISGNLISIFDADGWSKLEKLHPSWLEYVFSLQHHWSDGGQVLRGFCSIVLGFWLFISERMTTSPTKQSVRTGNARATFGATLEHFCAVVDAVMFIRFAGHGTATLQANPE
jgi:hypothetical protein